ncbi:Bifunctional protein PyrR [Streptomyces alboniger]
MDMETYDQLMVDRKAVGDAANFLIEGFTATVAQHEGEVYFVELPAAVELKFAVQLAVLVDRGHRELPIRADYVGKKPPRRCGRRSRSSSPRRTVATPCCSVSSGPAPGAPH